MPVNVAIKFLCTFWNPSIIFYVYQISHAEFYSTYQLSITSIVGDAALFVSSFSLYFVTLLFISRRKVKYLHFFWEIMHFECACKCVMSPRVFTVLCSSRFFDFYRLISFLASGVHGCRYAYACTKRWRSRSFYHLTFDISFPLRFYQSTIQSILCANTIAMSNVCLYCDRLDLPTIS